MVTPLYLAGTCLLVLPVVSGSTVDTFLPQSTVAFWSDASGKCRCIQRLAWSVSGYAHASVYATFGLRPLAVDCSTLSVPEEYNT